MITFWGFYVDRKDFKMERFILLCVILSSSQQQDTGCPTTVTLWKEKEAEFNCAMNKFYHCLRSEKQQTVQTCLERSWVQPGFCPEYNSVANEIDVFLCKESLGKCPEATFWSNELHKYSACLNATNIENKISKKSKQEEKKDENDVRTLLIVISVIALGVGIVVVIAITVVYCRRKKKSEQRNNDTELKGMKDPDTNARLLHRGDEIPIEPDHRNRNIKFTEINDSSDRKQKYNMQETQMVKTEQVYSTEDIDTLLDQHLVYPGDKLVMVVEIREKVPIIADVMKRKFPRFIVIEKFDHWSRTTDKEGYSVLLSCIMEEFSLSGHLNKYKDMMKNMMSDISKLNLRVVIPIRSDFFDDMKQYQLCEGLKDVRIT